MNGMGELNRELFSGWMLLRCDGHSGDGHPVRGLLGVNLRVVWKRSERWHPSPMSTLLLAYVIRPQVPRA